MGRMLWQLVAEKPSFAHSVIFGPIILLRPALSKLVRSVMIEIRDTSKIVVTRLSWAWYANQTDSRIATIAIEPVGIAAYRNKVYP